MCDSDCWEIWCDDSGFRLMCDSFVARLHLNAGKFDLDNEFFLDLAAPQKWVSTQVLWQKFFFFFGCLV